MVFEEMEYLDKDTFYNMLLEESTTLKIVDVSDLLDNQYQEGYMIYVKFEVVDTGETIDIAYNMSTNQNGKVIISKNHKLAPILKEHIEFNKSIVGTVEDIQDTLIGFMFLATVEVRSFKDNEYYVIVPEEVGEY